ncbi:MAG: iron-sulfur cluster-binding domain-containing protein [Moraxellaceae bacterium]|nr:MAG: iron-sulfur cluster-binding domain-containing protein [Moraxellaceae bacterium]
MQLKYFMDQQQLLPNIENMNLIIGGLQQLTPRLWLLELRAYDGKELPLVTAGSYIDLPIAQDSNRQLVASYAICSDPTERLFYTVVITASPENIATKFFLKPGTPLICQLPTKHFLLHADASPSVLIAEDIGIAAIKPIAQTLALRGRRFNLHYVGHSRVEMPFVNELEENFKRQLYIYTIDEKKFLDITHICSAAPANAYFYIAGSHAFIEDVFKAAQSFKISNDRLQTVTTNASTATQDRPVILELARSNKLIQVAADQPLLAALRDAGANVKFNCCVGDCGTCALKVIEGEPEHRDNVLSAFDKSAGLMCVCVSRAISDKLILDI